jgi:hypothetical protein
MDWGPTIPSKDMSLMTRKPSSEPQLLKFLPLPNITDIWNNPGVVSFSPFRDAKMKCIDFSLENLVKKNHTHR